jgi:hypothetical protein
MNWFRGMPSEVCRAIRARKAAGRVEELGERTPVHKALKAGAQKRSDAKLEDFLDKVTKTRPSYA